MPVTQCTVSAILFINLMMIRFVSILLLLSFYNHLNAQQVQCDCNLLINPAYFGKVSLYDRPNGKVIRSLKNDSLKENYLLVKAEKDSAGFVYGAIFYANSGKPKKGWIKKNKFLGTYSRNYGPELILYSDTDSKSKPAFIIREHVSEIGFCTVTQCRNKWVYVKLSNGTKEFSGWLSPNMQCANPYTTCN